ncbi:dioxygenase [Dipodascopsis tothii]|uniref:dioxygenase n=1 Tax=Dipodascopsis tothii TaxID=44089 RepID=UPI0034CE8DC3
MNPLASPQTRRAVRAWSCRSQQRALAAAARAWLWRTLPALTRPLFAWPPIAPGATSAAAVYEPAVRSSTPVSAVLREHHGRDRFRNPWPSVGPSLTPGVLFKSVIKGEWARPGPAVVPTEPPAFLAPATADPPPDKLRATWLGQACFYLEMPSGLRVLTDPQLSERCAPPLLPSPPRVTPLPCTAADLPGVDVVVISHSHYDHLDVNSIAALVERFPGVHFLVPLGLERWFAQFGVTSVTELDWWDEREVSVGGRTGLFSCLPAQHETKRGLFDNNTTLWSSWSIDSGVRVYFSGDTGYSYVPPAPPGVDDHDMSAPVCPAFAEIGEHRGPFDLALIGIGAYQPRGRLSGVHCDPLDAVRLFRDVRARRGLAMHWGTWTLSAEPTLEPPRKLQDALVQFGMPPTGVFDVVPVGASREYAPV